MKLFIKIADSEIAKKLAARNFQYIKEGSVYSFIKTDELMLVLQQEFGEVPMIFENRLRF